MVVSGVISLGFIISVLPATNAGANFQDVCNNGYFHGVICAQTPTGSYTTLLTEFRIGEGITSPPD